jgi:hypothetical protein
LSRIKAFDDEFDADSIPSFIADNDESAQDPASHSLQSGADARYDSVLPLKSETEGGRETSLKRSRPAPESEGDMVDELLPAAAAMKRRKLEMEKRGLVQASGEKATPFPVAKPKKKEKEIDVREAARKRREAEEEAERKERERDEKAFDEDQTPPTSPSTTRLQQEAAEIVGAIDVDSPRRTRLADKRQSQNARLRKRPAPSAGAGATKRQKTIQTRPASDGSDSDDLKFRFGRRDNA